MNGMDWGKVGRPLDPMSSRYSRLKRPGYHRGHSNYCLCVTLNQRHPALGVQIGPRSVLQMNAENIEFTAGDDFHGGDGLVELVGETGVLDSVHHKTFFDRSAAHRSKSSLW